MHEKFLTKNGLRIILAENQNSLTTTLLIMVAAGSEYEDKYNNGISHFLEHLCFQGTKKRPSALTISSELDGLGAVHNAFTSYEYTGYFVKSRAEHLEKALEVVSDIYLDSIFSPESLEKEKGVIIEEINIYEDNPMSRIADKFMMLLYGDQPAGWKISGPKKNIKKFARDDVLNYRKKHYKSGGTVVILSGKFPKNKALNLIKEKFASIPVGKGPTKIRTTEKQKSPAVLVDFKESEQARIIVGFRGFNLKNPLRFPAEVLSNILGGGSSSRLFEKIRNQMGAVYDIGSEQENFLDHGFIATHAGTEIPRIKEVIKAVLKEHRLIAEKGVSTQEIKKAKEHLKGHLTLSLETSNAIANFLGGQEILNQKIMTPEEIFKKIDEVEASQIKAVAKKLFVPYNLNLAILGPYKDKKEFEKTAEEF